MWLPSPIVRFLWGSPVVGSLMYARLDRQRRREPQAETVESFAASSSEGASKSLKWSLRIPVPAGDKGNHWGDLYFARDFAAALSSFGQDVEIHRRNNLWERDGIEDVSVVIRGLERVNPKPGKINILWIISTPELITKGELDGFDIIFVASNSWSEWVTKKTGIKVLPLLQCTDPKRFNPSASKPDLTKEIIFVGNARKRLRQIVKDFIDAQVPIKIYGKGWTGKVPQSLVGQQFIPNNELPIRYRSSKIVLNDHRPDMRKRGFYSNRLFDAVASGARVLSDDVVGLEQFFEGAVKTYTDSSELRAICAAENLGFWGTDDQIRDRAKTFGERHSFEIRAQEMIQAVHQLQKP
jgi:hypothetical protein